MVTPLKFVLYMWVYVNPRWVHDSIWYSMHKSPFSFGLWIFICLWVQLEELCLNPKSKLPHAPLILQLDGIRDCTPSFQIMLCWKVYPNTLWQGLGGSCETQCSLHPFYIFLLIHIIIPFVNEFSCLFFIDSTHVLIKFCDALEFFIDTSFIE